MSDDERGRRSTLSIAMIVLGAMFVVGGAVGVAAHYSNLISNTAARIASFTPLLILLPVVGVVLFLIVRAWWAAVVAMVVLIVGLSTQAPLYRGVDEVVKTSDITVMQANIFLGHADAASLVEQVRDRKVDILTVIELTPEAVGRLESAGLTRELPFAFTRPRDGGGGAGIFSRLPLADGALLPDFKLSNLRAVVDLPTAGRQAIYALHPVPPYPMPAWHWDTELGRLRSILSAERLPLIVGADFNSTYDHRQFRQLLAGSTVPDSPQLTDAAEHLGSGIVATYPANRPYPSLLALDRILTRGGPVPTSFERVDLPGSDHHGVVATIADRG
ncbi:endonuclease/exonuclease/phosphatase family protein [Gordonia sp. CPCC 205515]|uniref:endonuclease/exonuclease/phosphatase family protein n=1 Tax=Gordonia sp. CPCC 205515 TaxID=3140791 RepID=UPI003AF3F3CD